VVLLALFLIVMLDSADYGIFYCLCFTIHMLLAGRCNFEPVLLSVACGFQIVAGFVCSFVWGFVASWYEFDSVEASRGFTVGE
jgi:hypothetical protein